MGRETKSHPGKTPAQRRVLDAIGCGNFSPIMSKATRDALLRVGLIVEVGTRRIGGRGGRTVIIGAVIALAAVIAEFVSWLAK